jgi:hypothetical protein
MSLSLYLINMPQTTFVRARVNLVAGTCELLV